MKLKLTIFSLILMMGFSATNSFSQTKHKWFWEKEEAPAPKAAPAPRPKPNPKFEAYQKITKDAVKSKGMFTTFRTKDDKVLFEIDSAFVSDRIFLLSNRIAKTSNTKDFVAGQMIKNPFMIRFAADSKNVTLYLVQKNNEVKEGDAMTPSFNKNFADPILKTFKVMAESKDGKKLIDVTDFFRTAESCISPIKSGGTAKPGQAVLANRFNPANSSIESVKSFPENIEIRSIMSFDGTGSPYTITTHRSLILLPKEPMQKRLQDKKVGFFSSSRNVYTTDKDAIDKYSFIHRWRIEPREEDMKKYLAGELVTPKEQITFYVDTAFPDKWRGSILKGILNWNIAFEDAGFKDAVIAKLYPTKAENPDFDPEDMRFSCVKYAATDIANAMGPSYVDPRSGEIINGEVIWYHNVISLVHNWKFVQTAAVDKSVRKEVFPDDVMQLCIEYVSSHEVGHTLGLMHNFGASTCFPVDSLRSPSFTQKYGTTPSIMDYARNNYVAQPGDVEKGVYMTPPVMGVFDKLSIKWGYTCFDSKLKDEKPELDKILDSFDEKGIVYRFGAQQAPNTVDPRDQSESLGDDVYKANEYGFKNLRIIAKNLIEWSDLKEGESFDRAKTNYYELLSQYNRMVGHVIAYVGSVYYNENRKGDNTEGRIYATKAQTKRAIDWLFNEARTNSWLAPSYTTSLLALPPSTLLRTNSSIIGGMLNGGALNRIYEAQTYGTKGAYTLDGYMSDFVYNLMTPTRAGRRLTNNDKVMQVSAISSITKYSGLQPATTSAASSRGITDAVTEYYEMTESIQTTCCYGKTCSHNHDNEECDHDHDNSEVSFFRTTGNEGSIPSYVAAPIMARSLKQIKSYYEAAVKTTNDTDTKSFYEYQILQINKLFEK